MEHASLEGPVEEISRRVVETVLRENGPLLLADALHTEPFSLAESVARLKLLSVLCVPVRAEGKTLGALYLENRRASGVFTEEHAQLVAEFADRIGVAIPNAEAQDQLRRDRDYLQTELSREYSFEGVIGCHVGFRQILHTIAVAADSDLPILIEGESGTGKELLARAAHQHSPRRTGLMSYDYPGNIRELETIIRRAVLFARNGRIGIEALPPEIAGQAGQILRLSFRVPITGKELFQAKVKAKEAAIAKVERAFLLHALAAAEGRLGKAARSVGMNRSQFARMLSRYGLSAAQAKEKQPDLPEMMG